MKHILNDTRAFSFLGATSQQQFADLIVWEIFFQKYRIDSLVELGTGRGGISLFFLLSALQRKFRFRTYDITYPSEIVGTRLGERLEFWNYIRKADIFLESDKEIILEDFVHPMMLYCDNGDKPREVAEYGSQLLPGDFLAVHDFEVEIFEDEIPSRFSPILLDTCEKLGCLTRFYEVPIPF